jgi:hypothetical protein
MHIYIYNYKIVRHITWYMPIHMNDERRTIERESNLLEHLLLCVNGILF